MKLINTLLFILFNSFVLSCCSFGVIVDEGKGKIVENICSNGDCLNGHGTYIYKQGDSYTGYWKEGKRHGKGTMNWYSIVGNISVNQKTASEKYHNKKYFMFKHGTNLGNNLFIIGSILLFNSKNIYEQVKMSIRESKNYSEGVLRYTGEWQKGQLDGYGILLLPNGNKIRGFWKKGIYEGEK